MRRPQAACECALLPPGGLVWEGTQSLPRLGFILPAQSKAAAFPAIQVNGKRESQESRFLTSWSLKSPFPLAPPPPPARSCSRCHSGASPHWGSGFQVLGCFLCPEPGSCWEPQTGEGEDRGDTLVASGTARAEFDPGDHYTCAWGHAEFCTKRSYKASPRGVGQGTRCRLWASYSSSKKDQRRALGSWGSLDLGALPWARQVLVRERLLQPPSWEPTAVSLPFYLPVQALDWRPEAEAPPFSPQGNSPVWTHPPPPGLGAG